MTAPSLRQHLQASPALYPIAFDVRADAVQIVNLSATDYAAASFLDNRLLTANTKTGWARWTEFREAAEGLPERCHYIFHISHVGSTLLSRLVGQHPSLFSLREPAILRFLAEAELSLGEANCPWSREEFADRSSVYLRVWSRTFESQQTAVIKATSFVCELSEQLLERQPTARAVAMYVSPLVFLPALLGGAMSDITGLATQRLKRLERRLGAPLGQREQLSPGEQVAMSWLCEMLALQAAGDRFGDRVLWLDFDRFLADPPTHLQAAHEHFGAATSAEQVGRILAGPTMQRYAKAPTHEFDANTRRQLLAQAASEHAAEIEKGLCWLEQTASAIPAARRLLVDHGVKQG
jgi:hypothetical protein